METTIIQKQLSQPSIKLNKGITGGVGWEIKVYGDNLEEIRESIRRANETMEREFGKKEEVIGSYYKVVVCGITE